MFNKTILSGFIIIWSNHQYTVCPQGFCLLGIIHSYTSIICPGTNYYRDPASCFFNCCTDKFSSFFKCLCSCFPCCPQHYQGLSTIFQMETNQPFKTFKINLSAAKRRYNRYSRTVKHRYCPLLFKILDSFYNLNRIGSSPFSEIIRHYP
jgi:hypothetical protein